MRNEGWPCARLPNHTANVTASTRSSCSPERAAQVQRPLAVTATISLRRPPERHHDTAPWAVWLPRPPFRLPNVNQRLHVIEQHLGLILGRTGPQLGAEDARREKRYAVGVGRPKDDSQGTVLGRRRDGELVPAALVNDGPAVNYFRLNKHRVISAAFLPGSSSAASPKAHPSSAVASR